MPLTVFEPDLMGGLFADPEVAACLTAEAQVAEMVAFEAALARVEGRLGVIPAEAGEAISTALSSITIPLADLRDGTEGAGIPVPALVAALRNAAGPHGEHVHWGATSQDVMDTAFVLQSRRVLDMLAARLDSLTAQLAALAERFATTVIAARTRAQVATPTTAGLRIAGWRAPLVRCRQRLDELRPRLECLQFGGASGTLAALRGRGTEVAQALAAELGLANPAKPWHAERDGIAELAGWLSLLSGCLGKIAQDLVTAGRTEIGEVSTGAGGGSSTMPQKSNPVRAEAVLSIARFNAQQLALVHGALVHGEERDGAAWALEWMTLPQMLAATGAALNHVTALTADLTVNEARARETLARDGGAALAEAITFALADHMPLPEAQKIMKEAAKAARAEGIPLAEAARQRTGAPVDWQAFDDPANHTGEAATLVRRALDE